MVRKPRSRISSDVMTVTIAGASWMVVSVRAAEMTRSRASRENSCPMPKRSCSVWASEGASAAGCAESSED